jgi:hypothetical protein
MPNFVNPPRRVWRNRERWRRTLSIVDPEKWPKLSLVLCALVGGLIGWIGVILLALWLTVGQGPPD